MDFHPTKLALIALGGGVGSVLRYAVATVATRVMVSFPLGTLVVNVIGAGALGFLFAATRRGPVLMSDSTYAALAIGLLGGFTTFSTFANESISLANQREWGYLAANILLNNGLGLAAAWAGWRVAQRFYGVA